MSFSQALSGLRAQAENIKVISNNIANSQTVGFKSGNVLFADVFAGASSKVGLGVNIAGVMQDFRSGDLENTGRNLDLAIAGQGFYRLEKSNGEVVFSRNGEINQNQNGFLVNGTGQFLTGYGLADANDPFSRVIPGGVPQRLQIPQDDIPANATTEANAVYNLNASTIGTNVSNDDLQTAAVVTDNTTDPPTTANVGFHFSSSYSVYDSLGNQRNVTTYYTKIADNQWEVRFAMDGQRPGGFPLDAGGDNNAPDFVLNFDADGSLTQYFDSSTPPVLISQGIDPGPAFDFADSFPDDGPPDSIASVGQASDGTAANPTQASFTLTFPLNAAAAGDPPDGFDLGGAAELAFNLSLEGTTQFNNNSLLNTLDQNGYTSGTLIGIEVEEDGTVTRIYTNEERRAAGQIVLTNFINPEGLQPDGDNAWRQTNASGEPVIGVAGTGIFGTIEGGVLENSNVDLAQQLVDMIVSQRAYQANSSSIGTQDEMLQTVINL
ncbi:flagellar hook protein FlgE [Halochromatium roseum]|uniref:flagellar hook protein FlgE n=1 Tax=Halochromatium roseum TaxID=391920 RepID=UPI001913B374|nr:flagellar hook protein FlgE [Halochromatium roseum]MBK5939761.1 hypothetical protein [Halochromatium roseum]